LKKIIFILIFFLLEKGIFGLTMPDKTNSQSGPSTLLMSPNNSRHQTLPLRLQVIRPKFKARKPAPKIKPLNAGGNAQAGAGGPKNLKFQSRNATPMVSTIPLVDSKGRPITLSIPGENGHYPSLYGNFPTRK
jgi:hypothetical protein